MMHCAKGLLLIWVTWLGPVDSAPEGYCLHPDDLAWLISAQHAQPVSSRDARAYVTGAEGPHDFELDSLRSTICAIIPAVG